MGVTLCSTYPREAMFIADSLGTLEQISLANVLKSPWKDLPFSGC